MAKQKIVYVVINIDTEGPIKKTKNPQILSSWKGVYKLTDKFFSDQFRYSVKDSNNNPIVMNWFFLSLIGFNKNPHKRPMGFHKVHDRYLLRYKDKLTKFNDGQYWHYHQPDATRVANIWSSDWKFTNEYEKFLVNSVGKRNFYPCCYRAGGRIQTNDSSNWLENYIPFDYSCCSGKKVNWNNIEANGMKLKEVCDWSKTKVSWTPYHPSVKDYQKKGDMKRWLIRCVDTNSNVYKIDKDDIELAFKQANSSKPTILSFFEHDRRMISYDNIINTLNLIKKISLKYKNVKFIYANSKEAVINAMKIKKIKPPNFKVRKIKNTLSIYTNDNFFGKKPFVIIDKNNSNRWTFASLKMIDKKEWIIKNKGNITNIKVAAFSNSGEYKIKRIKL